MANEAYIGAGIVYVNGRDVGNCSGVKFSFGEETESIPNYRGGGGNFASRSRLSDVKCAITLYDFSNENLALALRGTLDTIAAASVTDEAKTSGAQGELVVTDNMIDTSDVANSVTVTGTAGTPTYVLNTDYTVTPAGIIPTVGGAITASTALEIDYDKQAGSALEALINSGAEVKVVADIKNEADNDRPVVVKIHRFKPSPASELPLIDNTYASFELTGEVLYDSTVVAAGKSKYFQVIKADAA